MKSGEVKFRVPDPHPHMKRISGKVDRGLVNAVILGQVEPERVVTDIKQLHPRENGLAFMGEHGWTSVRSRASTPTYQLVGNDPDAMRFLGVGLQEVTFDTKSGETTLITTTQRHVQTIIMNSDGKVTFNSGKERVPVRKLMD